MKRTIEKLRAWLRLTPKPPTAAAFRMQAARRSVAPVKPCPFCGMRPAENLDNQWTEIGGYYHQIICLPCGAAGPQSSTEQQAWAAWNERIAAREH